VGASDRHRHPNANARAVMTAMHNKYCHIGVGAYASRRRRLIRSSSSASVGDCRRCPKIFTLLLFLGPLSLHTSAGLSPGPILLDGGPGDQHPAVQAYHGNAPILDRRPQRLVLDSRFGGGEVVCHVAGGLHQHHRIGAILPAVTFTMICVTPSNVAL